MNRVDVYQGDSREVLKVIPDASVDAVVTDPPYALVSIGKRFGADDAAACGDSGPYSRASTGFMGQRWDTGETAFAVEFWREVYRVLKPGGHVVAFGGTRTYHRLACAIEDAGFEIRDMLLELVASDPLVRQFVESLSPEQFRLFARCIDESQFGGMLAWIYGSGFPKSHNVAKAIDAYLGEEGEKVARGAAVKRIIPGADQNRDGWSKTDGREYQPGDYAPPTPEARAFDGWGTALKPAFEPICLARKPPIGSVARNALAHGVGGLNIDACRVSTAEIWSASGDPRGGQSVNTRGDGLNNPGRSAANAVGRWPANVLHDGSAEVVEAFPSEAGAFAPVRGTEPSSTTSGDIYGLRDRVGTHHHGDAGSAARFYYSAKADEEDRLGSDHPTVKPVGLMAWLVRLITPPGGVVLDPFGGSGTTALAAMREGCDAIIIEREAKHADSIRRKVAWARGEGALTSQEILRGQIAKEPGKAAGEDSPLLGPLFTSQPASQPASQPGEITGRPRAQDRSDGVEAVRA